MPSNRTFYVKEKAFLYAFIFLYMLFLSNKLLATQNFELYPFWHNPALNSLQINPQFDHKSSDTGARQSSTWDPVNCLCHQPLTGAHAEEDANSGTYPESHFVIRKEALPTAKSSQCKTTLHQDLKVIQQQVNVQTVKGVMVRPRKCSSSVIASRGHQILTTSF